MVRGKTEPQEIYEIALDDIGVSEDNVRHTQRERDLEELAASIRRLGLLHPIELRGSPTDSPPYELIIGQRRFLAHKNILAKEDKRWRKIRAVFAGDVGPIEASIRSLAENMHRTELNHADAARAITELYKHYDHDDRRVADETGLSLRTVRDYIYIQERASEAMIEKLQAREVSRADVKRALRAAEGNIEDAERLLDMMTEFQLTGHEKKRVVEYAVSHPGAPAEEIIDEAQRPRVEESIIVSLPEHLRMPLQRAVEEMSMGEEEIVTEALSDWLAAKGFINDTQEARKT